MTLADARCNAPATGSGKAQVPETEESSAAGHVAISGSPQEQFTLVWRWRRSIRGGLVIMLAQSRWTTRRCGWLAIAVPLQLVGLMRIAVAGSRFQQVEELRDKVDKIVVRGDVHSEQLEELRMLLAKQLSVISPS